MDHLAHKAERSTVSVNKDTPAVGWSMPNSHPPFLARPFWRLALRYSAAVVKCRGDMGTVNIKKVTDRVRCKSSRSSTKPCGHSSPTTQSHKKTKKETRKYPGIQVTRWHIHALTLKWPSTWIWHVFKERVGELFWCGTPVFCIFTCSPATVDRPCHELDRHSLQKRKKSPWKVTEKKASNQCCKTSSM